MDTKETPVSPNKIIKWLLVQIAWIISKTFWFLTFRGLENIPSAASGPFIVASNHQTYIDPVWISLPIKSEMRFMAYDRAFSWRFIGPLIRYLGAFPVSLEIAKRRRAYANAVDAVRSGASVVIFPEGGRQFADGKPLPFRSGAVRLALETETPILPVTISGGNRVWPRGRKYPRLFRRVTVAFHPLIFVEPDRDATSSKDVKTLTERLRSTITGEPIIKDAVDSPAGG